MTLLTVPRGPTVAPFVLDPGREAHEPPEARGRRRDDVSLMVSVGEAEPVHTRFDRLGDALDRGDLVVVNTSATVPAALDVVIDDVGPVVVHVSRLPRSMEFIPIRQMLYRNVSLYRDARSSTA